MSSQFAVPYTDFPAQNAGVRDELRGAFDDVLDSGHYIQGPNVAAFEREFAKKIVTLMGGEFKNSITNDTDYLVCGSNVGKSKTDKAKKKGIKMLTENEFFELFS